ncbi:RNA-directed DNA polymerase, eukaryota, reverse transcriptase zinc-binding domain protein [Tanacetum coccineum]
MNSHIQDIEDMLLLLVQDKLKNLIVEERLAFNVSLRMFTRSIVIQRRVEDLQLGVESYQKKLNLTKPDKFKDHDSNVDFPPFINASGLYPLDREVLEILFSLDEVKNVVWDFGSNKAPGINGFTFTFVKKYLENFKEVFWSLSILFSILVRCLRVLTRFSSLAFLRCFEKKKKKLLILKVDFEKAFDSVIWKYLDFVLLSIGFETIWPYWIKAFLYSSRALVLVNGSHTSKFSIKHGLRQEYPLSPFLFILVMEGLHYALSNAVSTGVCDDNVTSMANNSGCASGSFPFTYLRLTIGSNMSLISSWQVSLEAFVVEGKPPFYKGGSNEARKFEWIKWNNVLSPFENGGLNLGSLMAFNLSLLQKWRSRMLSHQNALFVIVIKDFHGQEDGVFSVKESGCIIDSKLFFSLAHATL